MLAAATKTKLLLSGINPAKPKCRKNVNEFKGKKNHFRSYVLDICHNRWLCEIGAQEKCKMLQNLQKFTHSFVTLQLLL